MATRFYLNTNTSLYIPATIKGAWDSVPSSRVYMMGTNKFGGIVAAASEVETSAVAPWSTLVLRGVSSRLQPQTIAGHMNLVLAINENNQDANFYFHIHAWVSQGNTDAVRGILINNYREDTTNEWPTNGAPGGQGKSLQFAVDLASVDVQSGDRIVIELGFVSRNVTTSARTATIWYGSQTQNQGIIEDAPDLVLDDNVTIQDRAGWIEFTQNLLFEPVFESIGHIAQQTVQDVLVSTSRISHELIQVVGHKIAPTRIAHIIIQVVRARPIPIGDISGIYFINPTGTHDTYYNNVELKIPNPTIRLALFGE